MTDLEKFLKTLNDEETKCVNRAIANSGGKEKIGNEREFIDSMISHFYWDYRLQEEYAGSAEESTRIMNRLDELYSQWGALGFTSR